MGADVYDAADDLVIRLRTVHADGWADDINEAIEAGSTGTEIFMALRRVLTDLLADEQLDSETKARAVTLRDDLARALES